MKRNTMLTVIMMLSSVAAAVAAPEPPSHGTMVECLLSPEASGLANPAAAPDRRIELPTKSRESAEAHRPNHCDDDITAPYRLLHHGGMKLAAGCTDSDST